MGYRSFGLNGASAVDIAVARIRQGIRNGDYVPGQRLVAGDLSAELDLSGGPVREALTRLAGEGLVEVQPHRGAIVQALNQGDVVEIFELREVIEGLAARLCARMAKARPAAAKDLAQVAKQCREYASKADFLGYARANEAFHGAIYKLAGKPRVGRLARQLSDQVDRLSNRRLARIEVLQQSAAEHDLIVEAILKGNETAAEKAMRKHVRLSGDVAVGNKPRARRAGSARAATPAKSQ